MSRLSIIATPIGNLNDISIRALDVLRSVDLLCAEDSRHTAALLTAHRIPAREIWSLHEHNEHSRTDAVITRIQSGQHIGLVSDAGTPLVSDPGYLLVKRAIEVGITVTPIPGPTAAIAALSASGLPPEPFCFMGFAPKKSGKLTSWLKERARPPGTYIAYVPGRDVQVFVNHIAILWPDAEVVVARELTKLHETFYRGQANEVRIAEGELRGEATVLFLLKDSTHQHSEEQILADLRSLIESGLSRRDAALAVAYFRETKPNLTKTLANSLPTHTAIVDKENPPDKY